MGLYKGPSCKLCRREGIKLFLKSDKCETVKCPFSKRAYVPGQHGPVLRSKLSEYGIRMREKQKAKRFYYLNESQFRKYYEKASKSHFNTAEQLINLIEKRLDNFIYRSGLAYTRKNARQLVKHGHFLINGKKVDIPSFQLKEGDYISIREKSKLSFSTMLEKSKKNIDNNWIGKDITENKYTFNRIPTIEEAAVPVNMQFIIEFYSR
jgi:small subunit ribosomal protein S4